MNTSIVVAYIPVIHAGYLKYLASTGAKTIYALEAKDVPELPYLAREARAISLTDLTETLKPLGYDVKPFDTLQVDALSKEVEVYIPEDDATRAVAKRVFEGKNIVWGNSFLRWDWTKSTAVGFVQPDADRVIKVGDPLHGACSERMKLALEAAKRSSDWWRQVGFMIVPLDGPVIISYNQHVPHQYSPYMDGDPRSCFNPGECIEISTAFHSEQAGIAEAARRGIALEDAEGFVSTFPCHLCAPWIVFAGFKEIFFTGGYSNLNGQKILKERGNIRLTYVELQSV